MNFKILIPVALIAIGAGLYGLSGSLINQDVEQTVVEAIEDVNMITIWKTKQDIKQGDMVTREQFYVERVPESEANQNGIVDDVEIEFVRGAIASKDMSADVWVTQLDLVRPEQDGYIDLIIKDNMVPYGVKVDSDTIIGGVITHGSLIDVVALSSINQNLASSDKVQPIQTVFLSPILIAVKVLKVEQSVLNDDTQVSLVLELTRKQLAKLVIAKKISQLEYHKSVGAEQAELLQANSGDILPSYQAIKEFRAGDVHIK
ncbi:Flp pilus assembly protein CpaB [Vibrio algarum]|uniref:Flp pilus assembly protein CpaB n=1 Tax=Vibrio algarum TaxID=3020714 RepID=A0ABT4YNL2_9VIBR|nr:Flp pilus assembly protein CpaB [Vibrio sp. KJ40-1]MDB1123128.1 Flp pilus assembly protein CpaB [Vibrio sp. KJ40-1]